MEDIKKELLDQEELILPQIGRFSIASRIYTKNFKKVTFIIFDSETGQLRREVLISQDA